MAISALQLEVAPFKDIDIKAVLLHNIITDLLLSLQISDAFFEYMTFVEDKLKLNPGFVTQSLPLLQSRFDKWKLTFLVKYTTDISKESLLNIIMAVGELSGLGSYRLEKKGVFGQFKIIKVEELK